VLQLLEMTIKVNKIHKFWNARVSITRVVVGYYFIVIAIPKTGAWFGSYGQKLQVQYPCFACGPRT
jgi:hypothetical protein